MRLMHTQLIRQGAHGLRARKHPGRSGLCGIYGSSAGSGSWRRTLFARHCRAMPWTKLAACMAYMVYAAVVHSLIPESQRVRKRWRSLWSSALEAAGRHSCAHAPAPHPPLQTDSAPALHQMDSLLRSVGTLIFLLCCFRTNSALNR